MDVLDEIAHLRHSVVGRPVDFLNVETAPLPDFKTMRAGVARLGFFQVLAIQGLGKNPGGGGFPHSASAGKQIRVRHPVEFNRVAQSAHNMLLPDQLGEFLRTPFSGGNLKLHKGISKKCLTISIEVRRKPKIKGRIVGELTAHMVNCYRCFLPDLTGFTAFRRVGPGSQHQFPGTVAPKGGPQRGIQPR